MTTLPNCDVLVEPTLPRSTSPKDIFCPHIFSMKNYREINLGPIVVQRLVQALKICRL